MDKNSFRVGVVGATGLVGRELIVLLAESTVPIQELRLLASEKSAGKLIEFRDKRIVVKKLQKEELSHLDIVFFTSNRQTSKKYCPIASSSGAFVIDNSSEFRMDPHIPLVIPEVNAHAIKSGSGIIANPNCSTIQMLVVLKPLHDHAGIKRVVVSTYQSVSGVGKDAIDELFSQIRSIMNCQPIEKKVFNHQIAFNVIPHIDYFHENFYSNEEIKMECETHKILENDTIGITATTVRVPTFVGHGESVNVEFSAPVSVQLAKKILSGSPGIRVVDNPAEGEYPVPIECTGQNDVMVGRIRRDKTVPHGLNLWIVADNLRKGAAYNALQIAQEWIKGENNTS